MHDRDCAFKRARKGGDLNAWHTAKALRSKVAIKLRYSKKCFILNQLEQARGDSHKFWRIINKEFFGKTGVKITQVFAENGTTVLEGALAANELNRFFCNIGSSLQALPEIFSLRFL